MAHYAFLDRDNIVTEVIVGNDEDSSTNWEVFYSELRRQGCKRTSYNTRGGVYYDSETNLPSTDQSKSFRKNYAGIGYKYSYRLDAFIPPKPFESWNLNQHSCLWEPPIPYPDETDFFKLKYGWNEETKNWILKE